MQALGIIAILAVTGSAPAMAMPIDLHGGAEGTQWMGPSKCVSLTRSSEGSCVFTTRCHGVGVDALDTFEFALDCWNLPGEVVRHTFGYGGFDAEEEFDTQVSCQRCKVPAPEGERVSVETAATGKERRTGLNAPIAADHSEVKALQSTVSAALSGVSTGKDSHADEKGPVSRYGPGNCVSTWKDWNSGTCIMRTHCEGQDMTNYGYALMCIDDHGAQMKHLFGKGSFDVDETFDTLIECAQCLATNSTSQVEQDLADLKTQVARLNKAVFGGPAPGPAPAASPAAASSLVRVRQVHFRGNQDGQKAQREVRRPMRVTRSQDVPVAKAQVDSDSAQLAASPLPKEDTVDRVDVLRMTPEEQEELPRHRGPTWYGN